MRAFMGVFCGIVLGLIFSSFKVPGIVPGSVGIIILLAILFYIISYVAAKRMGLRLKTEEKKKISTNGVFPFIFLLIMFTIVTYTGLRT
jgi:sorbitol-specific phosphotransferase system component IIC